jgi:hypothetical protein
LVLVKEAKEGSSGSGWVFSGGRDARCQTEYHHDYDAKTRQQVFTKIGATKGSAFPKWESWEFDGYSKKERGVLTASGRRVKARHDDFAALRRPA